jgi:AraC-like DNA-binding protein
MPSSMVATLSDLDQLKNLLRGVDLKALVSKNGSFHSELTRIDLHRLWMQHGRQSLPQVLHFATLKERRSVTFLAGPGPSMTVSGIEVGQSDLIHYLPGAEHHLRMPADCYWFSMSMPQTALAEDARALLGDDIATAKASIVNRPPEHLLMRLRELHQAASQLARTVPDVLSHPEVARAMEQELVRAMIACLTSEDDNRLVRNATKPAALMSRFEALLRSKLDGPVYMTEICSELGIGERMLRYHCQEHLGMSPHRYLWLRRMQLAQQALRWADGSRSTVTSIANDYGFGELGRFSVSYRRLFGESPSATLKHI